MRHFKIRLVCCITLVLIFQSCGVDEIMDLPNEPCSPCTVECKTIDTGKAKSMLDFVKNNSSIGSQILDMSYNSCYPANDFGDGDILDFQLKNFMLTLDPSLSYAPFMDTIFSLTNIVHETYHGISDIQNGNKDCCKDKLYYHFIEGDAEIIVDQTISHSKTYANNISRKVKETLPAEFRNNMRIDRYLFYQTATVHSLLNEFAAYYFGVRTGYDFIPYHIEQYRETQDDMHLRLAVINVEGGITSYEEFKYAILFHLSIAEKNAPDYLKNVQQNTEFWTVFNKVDQMFSQAIEDYKLILEQYPEMKEYSLVNLDDESIFAEEIDKLSYLIVK